MDMHRKLVGNEGGSPGGRGGGGGKKDVGPPKPLPCPRCGSSNTKFCYYNNYNLNQRRFLCKGCRRYWTQGGALRNVPVGGGCRKSKRTRMGPSSSSAATQQQQPPPPPPPGFELITATTVGPSATGLTGVAGTGGGSSSNNNTYNNVMFGGVSESNDAGFFLPSLNIGPNMGLLHGFGLPSFQPNNNQMFQNRLYSTREIGSSSNLVPPVTGPWNLTMVPATAPPPPLSEPNIIINNNISNNNDRDNNNINDDNNQTNQWAEFWGNNGIEEP